MTNSDSGLSPVYTAAYDSIRKGAPGLSDITCQAIARSINMKVSLAASPSPSVEAVDAEALARRVTPWALPMVPPDLSASHAREWAIHEAARYLKAMTHPAPVREGFTVDDLAQEIRRVDGSHDLGAGTLAEALMPFLRQALTPSEPALDPRLAEWGYSSADEAIEHLGKLLDDQTAFDGLASEPAGREELRAARLLLVAKVLGPNLFAQGLDGLPTDGPATKAALATKRALAEQIVDALFQNTGRG